MNILLVTESLPSNLARARVTFIPKMDVLTEMGDFRPIAITPIITRAFHKILAQRMREELSFSSLQHAFLRRDGCLEASVMLHTLLRQAHEENKSMAAAFLDLAKDFDTVSHSAILVAARRAGMPAPLLTILLGCTHWWRCRWERGE